MFRQLLMAESRCINLHSAVSFAAGLDSRLSVWVRDVAGGAILIFLPGRAPGVRRAPETQ